MIYRIQSHLLHAFAYGVVFSLLAPGLSSGINAGTVGPIELDANRLNVLFLGDNGHHRPFERSKLLMPALAEEGIFVTYTDQIENLSLDVLRDYDVFMLYGNREYLSRDQEYALMTYVNEGGGFVAIHSASACFGNSDAYVSLVGGAFKAHGGDTFQTRHVRPDHPVKQGVPNFESWDETYVHMKHNPDRTVLSVRVEGDHEEPWTWVREQGEGRVFYTAWGHDTRTWSNPGFHKLIERGIRWAAGDWAVDADMALAAHEYEQGEMPYYPPGESWGVTGDPIPEVQKPISPERSLEYTAVQPQFRIEMFASEPDIVNPVDMTWDEDGRLWIIETVDYPNQFYPDRRGNDLIKILEDTNGDGSADHVTIFADSLNIATSLVLSNGGVIVAQAPDMLFLKDTTGDGRADLREVMFTGWGDFDTHAGPNNLQYGFDNEIWGSVGYAGFRGTVGDTEEELAFAQGFFRFPADASRLEFTATTSNNTWGIGFDEEGNVFGSTANGNPAVHSAIPNRFFNAVRGWSPPTLPMIATSADIFPFFEEVRQVDHHGRYTSGSGFHVYTARNYPRTFWNRAAFVTEPTGHLIGKFVLERNGSDFVAHNVANLAASRDEWFSPIQTKVGPDGALWFIDWYNLIIQHNPTPESFDQGPGNAYVTNLRDKDHGRIYRIVHEVSGNPLRLGDATPNELVQQLRNDNLFWRLTSQRLLVEGDHQEILPQLVTLVEDLSIDELALNPGALHALWTIHGLGALDGTNDEALDAAASALYHPSPSVRRAALMVLPRSEEVLARILDAELLPDPSPVPGDMDYTMPPSTRMAAEPQVRLAALLALAEMPPSEEVGRVVGEMLRMPQNTNDRWIRDAAVAAGARNDDSFLAHILAGEISQNADTTFRANLSEAVEHVSRHYAMGDATGISEFLNVLQEADDTVADAFLQGIADGWPEGEEPNLSEADETNLKRLRTTMAEERLHVFESLAESWGRMDLLED